jgi:hypothetical protein
VVLQVVEVKKQIKRKIKSSNFFLKIRKNFNVHGLLIGNNCGLFLKINRKVYKFLNIETNFAIPFQINAAFEFPNTLILFENSPFLSKLRKDEGLTIKFIDCCDPDLIKAKKTQRLRYCKKDFVFRDIETNQVILDYKSNPKKYRYNHDKIYIYKHSVLFFDYFQ